MGYFVGIKMDAKFDTLRKMMREPFKKELPTEYAKTAGLIDQAHITLAHLGKQMPDTETFQQVGESTQPFTLLVRGVTIFRNSQTTHLVLPVTEGKDKLRTLNASLRRGGRAPDRSYTPHMTIVSIPNDEDGQSDGYQRMLKIRDKFKAKEWGTLHVAAFHLFSSTQGVVRVVDRWALSASESVM